MEDTLGDAVLDSAHSGSRAATVAVSFTSDKVWASSGKEVF